LDLVVLSLRQPYDTRILSSKPPRLLQSNSFEAREDTVIAITGMVVSMPSRETMMMYD
jgi:hypothetical protein